MIKPLSDYVLLEKTPSEKKVGNVASVVAIGPGKKDEDGKLVPMSVKPGDRVVYREYAGTDIEDEGKKYILLKDEDILATIE